MIGFLWTDADHPLDKLTDEQNAALVEFKATIQGDPEKWTCKEIRENIGTFRLDDRMLLRFLIARDLDQAKAGKMLSTHLAWREERVPGALGPDDMPNAYGSGNLRYIGKTKQGVNVMLSDASRFEPGIWSHKEFEDYIIFNSERSIRLMDQNQSTQHIFVFDLAGWSLTKHGGLKATKMTKAMIDIAQTHYPERLLKAIVINSPMLFKGFWNVIYPFIDSKTRLKVEFGSADHLVTKRYMSADQLPKQYGGERDEDIPFHPPEDSSIRHSKSAPA